MINPDFILNITFSAFIIIMFVFYYKCLLSEKQNYTGITHDLSSYINFNWDYVYSILLIINIFRLIRLVK